MSALTGIAIPDVRQAGQIQRNAESWRKSRGLHSSKGEQLLSRLARDQVFSERDRLTPASKCPPEDIPGTPDGAPGQASSSREERKYVL
jgi:hypothetical protein